MESVDVIFEIPGVSFHEYTTTSPDVNQMDLNVFKCIL